MWSDDLYALVGVVPSATAEDVRVGWRTQLIAWHPDRNRDSFATIRTQAINAAHDILKDPVLRRQYDRHGIRRSPRDPQSEPPHSADEPSAAERARWKAQEEKWLKQEARWAAEAARERVRAPYYDLEDVIRRAYAGDGHETRDLQRALKLAVWASRILRAVMESLRESRSFYEENLASRGEQIASGDPRTPFPLWLGFLVAPVLQDRTALEEITQAAECCCSTPEVRKLAEAAWHALTSEIPAIVAHVRAHPGAIQARVGGEIGLPQPTVMGHCYWLAEAGVIRRTKAGRTFALTSRAPEVLP